MKNCISILIKGGNTMKLEYLKDVLQELEQEECFEVEGGNTLRNAFNGTIGNPGSG